MPTRYRTEREFLKHAEPGDRYSCDRVTYVMLERTEGEQEDLYGGVCAVISTHYNGQHAPGRSYTHETIASISENHATEYGISHRVEYGQRRQQIALAPAGLRFNARRAARAHRDALAIYINA